MTVHYDIVIIGSGAGGGTVARALADTGARILVLERGEAIPQEPENWSADAVWKQLRYRTDERWVDGNGAEFRPYTHYCVGGNTKFWGSVLYRLRPEDFQAVEHVDGVSPAWPISYETLAPFYDEAERMYEVHGEAGVDPTDPPRRTVSVRADPACAGNGGHRPRARGPGTASRAAAARPPTAGRAGRLHPLRDLQFLPVPDSREERRGSLCDATRTRAQRTSSCGRARARCAS